MEREVGAKLEKERAEVAVHRIDVIVIHHRGRAYDPRIGQAGDRAAALLDAEPGRLFLSSSKDGPCRQAPRLPIDGICAGAPPSPYPCAPPWELHERNLV